MDLSFSEDQAAVTELFSMFFSKECDGEVVRAHEPLGHSPALWRKLAEMGLTTMGAPVDSGGGGLSLLDLALVAEVFGRSIAPVPFVESVVGTRLLATAGSLNSSMEVLLDAAAIPTIALHPAIDGLARLVPAAAVADVAIGLDGADLIAIRTAEAGGMSPCTNFGCLPIADVDFRGPTRRVLASDHDARSIHSAAVREWKALTASALVGLGRRALDIGLDYVKGRQQFGVPIGSFQAVQHRLADAATLLDAAELLCRKAAWAVDVAAVDADALVGQAFVLASEAAQTAASDSLHFHGGYGFMLEYDIQLYYRRAKAWSVIWDDPRRELLRVADALYGPVGDN